MEGIDEDIKRGMELALVRLEFAEKNPGVASLDMAERVLLRLRTLVQDRPEKALWSAYCCRLGEVRNRLVAAPPVAQPLTSKMAAEAIGKADDIAFFRLGKNDAKLEFWKIISELVGSRIEHLQFLESKMADSSAKGRASDMIVSTTPLPSEPRLITLKTRESKT